MLFDVIASFHKYLEGKYAHTTVRTYANALETLLKGQNLNFNVTNMDMEKVIEHFSKIKYKNHFSKAKNAFLLFCEFSNYPLFDFFLTEIKILEAKTVKKYRRLKALDFWEIDKKIKRIKNLKLKLSYQTIIATGLRVSELAQITIKDCAFLDSEALFTFTAKGGKEETIKIIKNEHEKLFDDLKKAHVMLSKKDKPTTKMFYSAVYLQAKAKVLGFSCHDLRRAFAKLEYRKTKSKKEVMQKLRHSSMKNTNIYLRSKIKI